MSLAVLQTVHAMGVNLSVPFGATGGTAPYTWSVFSGTGVINASTGQFTAPTTQEVDIVRVTDNVGAHADYTMQICTPLMLVADIIQTAMGLSQGHVYLWDQKINIPIDSGLYIAVGVTSSRAFGNNTDYVGTVGNFKAIQSVNVLDTLSIDVLSRGPAARDQKELVLLALNSPYAESQMELNSFFVAPQSTNFVNLSEIDGAAIPYRFQIAVNLQYFVTNESNPPYYDSFTNPPTTVTES